MNQDRFIRLGNMYEADGIVVRWIRSMNDHGVVDDFEVTEGEVSSHFTEDQFLADAGRRDYVELTPIELSAALIDERLNDLIDYVSDPSELLRHVKKVFDGYAERYHQAGREDACLVYERAIDGIQNILNELEQLPPL